MNQLDYQETYDKIYVKVLNYLSYKPRSQHEVITYIDNVCKKWNINDSDSQSLKDKILDDLLTRKYVNDQEYVNEYIRGSTNSPKAKSVKAMKLFLYKKGINNNLVALALSKLDTSELEKDAIQKLADKKLKSLQNLQKHEQKSKLIRFLLQKGYQSNNVYTVVDSILGVK